MQTIKNIAKTLKTPSSTISYHIQNYKEFIPSKKIEGNRWDMYEDEAISILRIILKDTKQGKKRQEIKEELEKKYKPIFDGEQEKQTEDEVRTTNKQLLDNQPRATILQQTAGAVFQLTKINKSLLSQIETQNQLLEEKDKTITRLKEKVKSKTYKKLQLKQELKTSEQQRETLQIKLDKQVKNKKSCFGF